MDERFAKFTMTLSRLNRNIQKMKTDGMGQFGLKGVDTLCLYQLAEGGELTFSQVAERCDLDAALVSRTLGGLVKKDMVEKSGLPGKYNATYRLTDRGAEYWSRIHPIITEIQRRADQGVDPEELVVFYRVLDRLNANFEEMNETFFAPAGNKT